jgi:hypothetical protein
MAEDGKISIGFDWTELEKGLDEASQEINNLVDPLNKVQGSADRAADALDDVNLVVSKTGAEATVATGKFGVFRQAISKVFGEGGALSQQNMATAFSSMQAVITGSTQIADGMNQIADAGTSAGDKINAGMIAASAAVGAFATGGPIAMALTVVAALGQQIATVMNAATEEANAAKEAFDSMAEAAASAGQSIRLMQLEEQQGQAMMALRKLENQREIAKEQMQDAQNLADLQERLQKEGDARYSSSEHQRQKERIQANKQAVEDLTQSIKVQTDALGLYSAKVMAQSAADSVSEVQKAIEKVNEFADAQTEAISRARQERETAQEKKPKKEPKAAPAPGDPVDAYAAYYKEQVAEQKRFLAEERAIEEKKAKEQAERSAARIQQERNEAALIAQVEEELAAKRADIRIRTAAAEKKDREERLAKIKDQMKIADIGLKTITSTLFDMAKTGELSINKLLEATLHSIGQHMVAEGTQRIFQGTAMTLLKQPEGPQMIATGLAEVAAGVTLGAASGAIARQDTGAGGGAPAQSPADTRQTQAAASGATGQGGPVVINFEGDVYDKRGVANVLNQGLGMARHRRLRGA